MAQMKNPRLVSAGLKRGLGKSFERARQVDFGAVIDAVHWNSSGEVTSVTARVQDAPGIPIQIAASPGLEVGQRVIVENLGTPGSPIWAMRGSIGSGDYGRPYIMSFDRDRPIKGVTYHSGDFLIGWDDEGSPNFFFDESEGTLYGRSGLTSSMGLNALAGSAFFGRQSGPHIMITGSQMQFKGPTGAAKILLDGVSGSISLDGSMTVGSNGHIKGGMTDYAAGSGFYLGTHGGVPKFAIGTDTKFLRWDGITGLHLSSSVIQGYLDIAVLKANFLAHSWSQFAIFDDFSNTLKRAASEPGYSAQIQDGILTNGGDATASRSFTWTSKSYSSITTVKTGTSTGVGSGYLDDSSSTWFDDQYRGYVLVDSAAASFDILHCIESSHRIEVSGTPASGAYSIKSPLPTRAIAWISYFGAGGDIKLEFSTDDGSHWQTVVNTATSTNLNGSEFDLTNVARTYVFKITLTNSAGGVCPQVNGVLISTDPSIWK